MAVVTQKLVWKGPSKDYYQFLRTCFIRIKPNTQTQIHCYHIVDFGWSFRILGRNFKRKALRCTCAARRFVWRDSRAFFIYAATTPPRSKCARSLAPKTRVARQCWTEFKFIIGWAVIAMGSRAETTIAARPFTKPTCRAADAMLRRRTITWTATALLVVVLQTTGIIIAVFDATTSLVWI